MDHVNIMGGSSSLISVMDVLGGIHNYEVVFFHIDVSV